jgi:F-type H+-transporting ATPase subunit gamma
MPANLKDLRSRIKSIATQQKIIQAMKMVAASKFGRAQSAVVQARPYANNLGKLVGRIAASTRDRAGKHPLLQKSESNVVAVLVISSERGLCGGYNSNVAKMAMKTIEELEAQGKEVFVTCVGKKAYQVINRKRRITGHVKGAEMQLTQETIHENGATLLTANGLGLVTTSFEKPTFDQVSRLAKAYIHLFEEGKIGKLVVVYNKFVSAMTQIPTAEDLLPLTPGGESAAPETGVEPIFEPDADSLLSFMLPRSVTTRLFQIFLEATASEHGSRMSAMDSASRNAKDLLKKYQVTYQRARQASITRELIEIISGAEAL